MGNISVNKCLMEGFKDKDLRIKGCFATIPLIHKNL